MSKEIARKQIEVSEISYADGAKGIKIGKDSPIVIGYDEGDIVRLLQMIFLPNADPIRDKDTISDKDLVSLMREAVSIGEAKLENETNCKNFNQTLIDLVRSGEPFINLEVIPDAPTRELLRAEITTEEIERDVREGFTIEWYTWDVVSTVDLEDKTRVIIHVP